MNNQPQRPALGQEASLGTLYDARNDSFLSQSLLNKELPPDSILSSSIQKKVVQVSYVDSYKEKFDRIGVGTELGGSILAGLVNPSGSGRYLSETQESSQILYAALHQKITTVQERLTFRSDDVKDCLDLSVLLSSEATHVVIGIEWGAESIVTVAHHLPDRIEGSDIEDRFRAEVEEFKLTIEKADPRDSNGLKVPEMLLEVTAYSDILANEGIIMHNFREACDFLDLMPLHIKDSNGGKGKPIVYTLLPVGAIPLILQVDVEVYVAATPPSPECLKKYIHLFDEYRISSQKLHHYQSFVLKHKLYMPENHMQAITDRVRNMKASEDALKAKYARVLQDVRGGASDPEDLWQLLRESTVGELSPEKMATVTDDHREKVEFIDKMVSKGATYIGHNGLDMNTELSRQGDVDAYIFMFSKAARKDESTWNANQVLFLELLAEPDRKNFIAIVDCDATARNLEKSHISHYQKGQQVSNDLLEQRQFLADKCFARYNQQSLETKDVQKPVKRRFVKIPCPGLNCNKDEAYDWMCSQCLAPIEYGFSDRYIYCDCGRSLYSDFDFKCKSKLHGPGFDNYDRSALLTLLKNLNQSSYLNILILGETGVGKSTFINAFVNYLTFETLDESMKAEKLNWVIPCSFSTQIMDRSRLDGKIQQIDIKVGSRDDENDGSKGASATQQTTVYPVTIGSSTIRLIDTPGIGDTRGLDYDRKNMADILSTLSSYDELHGVLILLKSNNSRLTVTFSFCIKELLTHLHRSAAKNMVFGFTNTRISNYTPGDTFGPLKTLLNDHSDVGLSLSVNTTYCFDSESFRYLAAYKKGIVMENQEDFRRSWKHSRDEALRLLDHFKSQTPHLVKSTISLNGTRELILELTKPMAEISQLIRRNIAMCEDKMQELKDTRLGGDQLRKRLHLQKVQLKPETLNKPRTVCHDASCTEFKDDGNGENRVVTIYKTHCHKACHLKDVKADQIAHPGLIHCAAFQGSNHCTRCGHHWQQHLHVLYELHEHLATVTDSEIEKQLGAHADDITLKQTAIKELEEVSREYSLEHEQIQKAAAEFGVYLKKYSITPYNDATIAYLDFLIKEERAKVEAGGNRKKLDALEEDRQKYVEYINILSNNMKNDANWQPLSENGVDRRVKQLYSLKHFGNNLRAVKQTITSAHQATYREMPYRVKTKSSWSWVPSFQGIFQAAPQPSHSTMRTQASVRRGPAARTSTSRPMSVQTMRPISQMSTAMPVRGNLLPDPNQSSIAESSSVFNFSLPSSLNLFAKKV